MSDTFRQLVAIGDRISAELSKCEDPYAESPFRWLKTLPSRTVGKAGEKLVAEFLRESDFNVSKSGDSDADIVVNEQRVEIKCSTLWKGGMYKFQQIRDQKYNILFCLGISPKEAHAWVVRKEGIVWNDIKNQHGGKGGSDTWWISFNPPHCPHDWMRPQDGNLGKVCDELRRLL